MFSHGLITVLIGHAGVGKTNAALGLAFAGAKQGLHVTLADLDVVSPYFRSSDHADELEAGGVRVLAPRFAGTTLDTPSLTGELDVVIDTLAQTREGTDGPRDWLIIDCGGDGDGATILGRYAPALRTAGADLLYVVSAFRALTPTARDAAALLPALEMNSHLGATGILNASNLGDETTPAHVRRGRAFAHEVAELLHVPLVATLVPEVAIRSALATNPSLRGQVANLPGICTEAPRPADGGRPATPRTLDPETAPQIAALLTEDASWQEELLVMPRFVVTPWDEPY